MTPFLFAAATFASTMLGGAVAMRFKQKLHLLMGFAAGVLLGVVAFEIFPEIIEQVKTHGFQPNGIMISLVSGFLLFHVSETALGVHHGHEEHYVEHRHPDLGALSALALAGHSFMDGVAIGLGFQVSRAVGVVVGLAVITHDFTDGMNSVTVLLRHDSSDKRTWPFLVLDAAAPLLGIVMTRFVTPSQGFLVCYLGFFAGFLLYIGASDILPEAHSRDSSRLTVAMTVLGTLLMYLASRAI
jgi:ZIP family zinc transporter